MSMYTAKRFSTFDNYKNLKKLNLHLSQKRLEIEKTDEIWGSQVLPILENTKLNYYSNVLITVKIYLSISSYVWLLGECKTTVINHDIPIYLHCAIKYTHKKIFK